MTQPVSGAKKDEDRVTKKAKTKKTGRTHAAKPDAKPRHVATHAHVKRAAGTTHPANHLTHAADPIVMAVIDSVSALADEPAKSETPKTVTSAKSEAPKTTAKKPAKDEANAPSLLARVVSLVSGVAEALLPKKLVIRRHAH